MPVHIGTAKVMTLLTAFSMKGHEMDVFQMLARRPMTIKELQRASRMSERMLRMYLDDLVARRFVSKQVVEGERLKYVYSANPPAVLEMAQNMLSGIEKNRKRMARDIVRGSKRHIQWRR